MSNNNPVDPAEVPVFTGELPVLDEKVKALSGDGGALANAGTSVHTTFGGLSAYYKAPEAEQLFAVTKPVVDITMSVSGDMCTIAGALGSYANEIRPLVKQLETLKTEAASFKSKVSGDHKWNEDGDLVDENRDRRNKIAEVWSQFQAAERTAYDKIVALVCGTPLKVDDGSHGANMYGYDAEALKHSKSLPWGDAVEESVPWWQVWEHAYDFGKGVIVDGVWGTIKGLGTLVGFDGWDATKQAWTGLAKLATGVSIAIIPGVGSVYMAMPGKYLPSWLRDSRTAMKETGKAMLAWDQWSENPSRAAGAVTFNVVTAIFTDGAGAAAEGAGKAGIAAKALSFAGKAGRAIDPMTYVFKGAGAGLSKIGDVMAGLRGMGKIEIPKISEGAFALPDGASMLPDGTIHLPSGTAIPEGAIKLPDGGIKLPEGTATLPPGTVKLPFDDSPAKYMDADGNLYKQDGSLFQRAEDAKPETAPHHATADAPKVETPVLVGVGAHNADNVIRLGSDISDPVHAADNAAHGSGHPDTNPGGHAPDGMPRNDLNTTPGTPHPSGDTPSIGGHPDGPGGTGAHPDGPSTGGAHPDGPSTGGPHLPDTPGAGGPHLPDTPGAGGLDGLGHGADDAADAGAHSGEEELTPERRKELQDEHVRLANEDTAWFQKHYRDDGHRWSKSEKVDGVELPILKKDADGNWISRHNMPNGPSELRYGAKSLGPDSVPTQHRAELNGATADRRVSIDLTNAQKAFEDNPSIANQEALTRAQEAYDKRLPGVPNNSAISETLGEKAATLHVIPHEFDNLVPINLPKTGNGANMFDAAYELGDDRYLIVEAKAPKGDLDWRNGRADPEDPSNPHIGDDGGAQGMRVKQGTKPYIRTILAEMTQRGGEDARIAKLLRDALKQGKLQYVLVKANDAVGSTYAGGRIEHLKIN